MTPLETLLLISFAMLTCLQTTLTWLNSRIRRGLIAPRWPVATWEPIIGGQAQCVWSAICISHPLSLWGDGTLLAGKLALSTVGTSCVYIFFFFFCFTFSVSVCPSTSLCPTPRPLTLSLNLNWSRKHTHRLIYSCVLPYTSVKGQTEPGDYHNDAGLLCMMVFAQMSCDRKMFIKKGKFCSNLHFLAY